ncbi:secretory pathway Sec39 family protein [Aspergillus undulatus]|uniref:secretory pathway Sec39 family protein n=1 Tax=Aspergillus undulatus TaxID=1810928 RepID=UPI003CCDB047
MADSIQLSGAHAILLAARLCATRALSSLPQLQARFPATLTTERLLRIILTFLPESTAPSDYISIVEALVEGSTPENHDVDISPVKDLSETEARKRVRKIRLLPLRYPGDKDSEHSTDLLTIFLIHRAYRIDSETSLQPLILELLLPFYQRSPILRTWLVSLLLPLLRLNYEYYPQDKSCSVETLDSLDDQTATNILLSMSGTRKTGTDLIQNLRGLVGPWMYGSNRPRRQQFSQTMRRNSVPRTQIDVQPQDFEASGWGHVNDWLLSRSLVDPEAVVNAFINWDGPEDVDLGGYVGEHEKLSSDHLELLRRRYGQTGLAVIYQSPEVSLECSVRVLERVSSLLNLEGSYFALSDDADLPSVVFDANTIQSASRATLFQNALLTPTNPLTCPTTPSISFLSGVLLSLRILEDLGHPIPCRTATNICLHSNQDMQLFELRGVMASIAQSQSQSTRNWKIVRQKLLWLRDWKSEFDRSAGGGLSCHGLFYQVPLDIIEAEILKVLLDVREYNLAVDIYVRSGCTLSPAQTENAVKESIFAAYDNASNGNRTRGRMQRAYEILQAFLPHFPDSASLREAQALIAATHALSFYSLTLQHGVPFQPVSIRVHPDPLSLIERVLDQNPRSYTKLDDLLSIGRNLVLAGFPPRAADDANSHSHYTRRPVLTQDEALITAERRIMSLAISSALSSDDFGTAYSYILTRLTPSSSPSPGPTTTTPNLKDNITWRAVYNAGRYRPTTSPTTPQTLQSQITRLTQRMELLSLSLILAPTPDPLPEILGAWRRADEGLSFLRVQESEEEDAWATRGDRSTTTSSRLPGGFSSQQDPEADAFETKQQHARRAARAAHHNRLDSGEAPMGLFEVARGAARALHKNVNSSFPLRGTTSAGGSAPTSASMSSSMSLVEGDTQGDEYGENGDGDAGRVRKRDMVSNMVTGGLASGIGWVLGAQPVNMNNRQ